MFEFLLYTQLIEVPIFLVLFKNHRTLYAAGMMVLINCFTWPIATLLFQNTYLTIWTIEATVIAMEMVLFKVIFNLSWTRAFAYAFIINAVSTAAGFLFPGHYAGRL